MNEVAVETDRSRELDMLAGPVAVVTSDAEFDALESVWRRIATCDKECTVFQSWDFLRSQWAYRKRNKTLHILTVRSPQGEIRAIAPFYIFHIRKGMHFRILEFIGTRGSDYQDIISLPDMSRANALSLILKTLLERDTDWNIGHLYDVRKKTAGVLSELLRTGGTPFIIRQSSSGVRIPLPETYEAYRQSLGKSTRKDMNYDERRLEKNFTVQFDVLQTDGELLRRVLTALQEVHDRRWAHEQKAGSFHEDWMKRMDHDFVTSAARSGILTYFVLSIDGRPVAGLSGFAWNDAIITHTMSVSTEDAFRNYSIGNVLLQKAIRWSIEHGFKVLDLTRGSEEYKFKFGAVAEPNFEFFFFRGPLPYLAVRTALALKLDRKISV